MDPLLILSAYVDIVQVHVYIHYRAEYHQQPLSFDANMSCLSNCRSNNDISMLLGNIALDSPLQMISLEHRSHDHSKILFGSMPLQFLSRKELRQFKFHVNAVN